MKVAITGACGFIGKYLVREVRRAGYSAVGIDIVAKEPVDILDQKQLIKATEGCGAVYHLAGPVLNTCRKKPYWATQLTIMGTLNVLEACRVNKIPKICFASTFYVYDGIDSQDVVNERTRLNILDAELFGSVKLMGESLVKEYSAKYGLKYVIFRFGSAYGPDENCSNVVKDFVQAAKKGEKYDVWGAGKRKNQYTYVGDIAKGCVLALPKRNQTYNLISPEQTSTGELAETINKKLGFDYFFDSSKPEGKSMPFMSSLKAVCELGWEPIKIADGVDIVIGGIK